MKIIASLKINILWKTVGILANYDMTVIVAAEIGLFYLNLDLFLLFTCKSFITKEKTDGLKTNIS